MGAHGLAQNLAAGLLFFSSSVIAALAIYLFSRPPRRELGITGAGALLMAVALGLTGPLYIRAMLLFCYWGISAFFYNFIAAIFETKTRRLPVLEGMILVPVAVLAQLPMNRLMSLLTIRTADYYLYAFDGSFGFQPGFWAGQLVQGTEWLKTAGEFCYINLPLGMVLLWLLERRRSALRGRQILHSYLLLAGTGFLLYFVCPGVGTVVVFQDKFPDNPPPVALVNMLQIHDPAHPRNCIPSLHTGWTLAVLWFSMHRRRLLERMAWGTFAAFTLLYALSCGHYLVDMVAAIPFAAACYFASRRADWPDRAKFRNALTVCAGCYLVWIAFIRWGEPLYSLGNAVPWTASVLTAALTWWMLRWFHDLSRTAGTAGDELLEPTAPGIQEHSDILPMDLEASQSD